MFQTEDESVVALKLSLTNRENATVINK